MSVFADLAIYVRLHRSRIRRRDYDQSKLFIEAITDYLGVPLTTVLTRTRSGRSQVEMRDRTERIRKVAGVFEAMAPPTIARKKVPQVDDVMTTVGSVGKGINDSGAHYAFVATLTRTL